MIGWLCVENLGKAVRRVRRFSIDIEVSGFFARRREDRVFFERTELLR